MTGETGTAGFAARLVKAMDWTASAALAFATALTFAAVIGRYVLGIQIPDNFDFSRLVVGISIIWGLGSVNYEDEHISMDAVSSMLGAGGRRVVEFVSVLVTLIFTGLLTVLLLGRVHNDYLDQTTTFNLGIEIWPFHLAAWMGLAGATVLLLIRLAHVLAGRPPPAKSPAEHFHG